MKLGVKKEVGKRREGKEGAEKKNKERKGGKYGRVETGKEE